jgi:WhiB family redox-sensing transcriptional regulator
VNRGEAAERPQNETWMDDALCTEVDPDLFFPEVGGFGTEAKKVCAQCPVAAQCLEYALAHNETDGIWGGLSPKQRKALARRRGMQRSLAVVDYERVGVLYKQGYCDSEIGAIVHSAERTIGRWRDANGLPSNWYPGRGALGA